MEPSEHVGTFKNTMQRFSIGNRMVTIDLIDLLFGNWYIELIMIPVISLLPYNEIP